jgi:hypothetical protein
MAGFCRIEWTIPNKETKRWKIADAYYADMKTCIEFQHSYISFHFEEKNEFYRRLSLQTVWLYDLSRSNINACADGSIEILEDNARGFFRISENADNLRDNFVYIQVKSGKIYRVTELGRRETSQSLKSTIRHFLPSEIFEEQEFVTAIQNNSLKSYEAILSDRKKAERQRQEQEAAKRRQEQEAAKRRQEQEAERIAQEKEAEKNAAEKTIRLSENTIRLEMRDANYEQSDHDVLDRNGRKWIKCKFCNQAVLYGSSEMYYFIPGTNKGCCQNCCFRR